MCMWCNKWSDCCGLAESADETGYWKLNQNVDFVKDLNIQKSGKLHGHCIQAGYQQMTDQTPKIANYIFFFL